jgi:hypothetical protein
MRQHGFDCGTNNRIANGNQEQRIARRLWSLHHGRSVATLVRIIPDIDSPLHRIEWSDVGLSDCANLTRCKDAALAWAERHIATKDRKTNAARRLKSLDNFWWSSSLVHQSYSDGEIPVPKSKLLLAASVTRGAQ